MHKLNNKSKRTFGTRSTRGNRFVERMLIVMMTTKQAEKNIIQAPCDQLQFNQYGFCDQNNSNLPNNNVKILRGNL